MEQAMTELDYTDADKVSKQVQLFEQVKRELDEKYMEWEKLGSQ
jgi:hypothetical protein